MSTQIIFQQFFMHVHQHSDGIIDFTSQVMVHFRLCSGRCSRLVARFLRFGWKNTFQGARLCFYFMFKKCFFPGTVNFGETKSSEMAPPRNPPIATGLRSSFIPQCQVKLLYDDICGFAMSQCKKHLKLGLQQESQGFKACFSQYSWLVSVSCCIHFACSHRRSTEHQLDLNVCELKVGFDRQHSCLDICVNQENSPRYRKQNRRRYLLFCPQVCTEHTCQRSCASAAFLLFINKFREKTLGFSVCLGALSKQSSFDNLKQIYLQN